MNLGVGFVGAVLGAVAGFPAAGLASAVPVSGRVGLPRRWWASGGASHAMVVVMSLSTGAVAGALGLGLGRSLVLPAFWATAVLGVALAVVDVRRHRLPYVFSVPIYCACSMCLGVVSIVDGDYGPLLRALVASAAVLVGLLVLALAFPGQLGLGDVVLAGSLALSLGWLGWSHVVVGLGTGLVFAAGFGAVRMTFREIRVREFIALGPWLLSGWLLGCLLPV